MSKNEETVMKIEKIINNNIVSSIDQDGNEVVVMGRGLGFQRRTGELIEESAIEKIFRIENHDSMEQFKNLLKNLPVEYIRISNDIISYAKEHLRVQLSQTVYLTLTDHISFVIDQFKNGRTLPNMLHEEVRRFYQDEYEVGIHALSIIQEKTGFTLPEDEATAIALHLVNAEFNQKVKETLTMTNLMNDMLRIIEHDLGIAHSDSVYKGWLIINLKFLAHRVTRMKANTKQPDPQLSEFSKRHYNREYALADKIKVLMKNKYDCTMTEEEKLYLVLHIARIKDLHLMG